MRKIGVEIIGEGKIMKVISLMIAMLMSVSMSINVVQAADNKAKPDSSLRGSPAGKMNNARLAELINRIDKKAKGRPGHWQLVVDGKQVLVITDEKANRMRIVSPITESGELTQQQLYRIMQANFDSALDARYAVAKEVLWSAFIHPLSSLSDREFLVGVGQVVNLVSNYGSSFSSGALIFRGGDSNGLEKREVIDNLLEKGLSV